jgi:hypothetical protein
MRFSLKKTFKLDEVLGLLLHKEKSRKPIEGHDENKALFIRGCLRTLVR